MHPLAGLVTVAVYNPVSVAVTAGPPPWMAPPVVLHDTEAEASDRDSAASGKVLSSQVR